MLCNFTARFNFVIVKKCLEVYLQQIESNKLLTPFFNVVL